MSETGNGGTPLTANEAGRIAELEGELAAGAARYADLSAKYEEALTELKRATERLEQVAGIAGGRWPMPPEAQAPPQGRRANPSKDIKGALESARAQSKSGPENELGGRIAGGAQPRDREPAPPEA